MARDTPVRDASLGDPPADASPGDPPAADLVAGPAPEPAVAVAAADPPKYSDSRVDEQTGITWIWLHHPKTQGEFEATVEAYEQEDGWKERGWEPGRLPEAVTSTPAAGGVA